MIRRILPALIAIISGLASCTQSSSPSAPPPAKVAAAPAVPPPPRISFDNQCFMIDGKDTFLYSGAFHYFRCPKPLWADRFQKMKDAGLNCVETYVAWNWHEQQPPSGLDDFSKVDMSDLTDWLDMAINRYGFYVILRPGPYICAEWDGGGYPQWLVTKRPANARKNWLRSDDPVYLDWCKHWYTAAAKAAVPFQITHMPTGKPGVILWQIENEYNYAAMPRATKLNQLRALAHDSLDMGINVPLITCMTSDTLRQDPFLRDNVIECRNTYPWFRPDDELHALTLLETYQPDKPRMVTELQGGWFSENGGQLNSEMGFTPQQLNHVTLLAWAHGFTGTNYYMMFGGTNLGDWGSANKTTSYDYAAPIHEWGGVGPRYFAVQAMANFLKEHASQLIRSMPVDVSLDAPQPDGISSFERRTGDGSKFLFVFNDQNHDRAVGDLKLILRTADIEGTVHYDLDPYDAKILYFPPGVTDPAQAHWYPEPVAPPQRPTDLPSPINITEARRQVDPGPSADSWRDLPDGGSVEDVGIFDRRFVYYLSSPLSQSHHPMMLSAKLAEHDSFIAQINDNRLDTERHGRETIAAVFSPMTSGNNQLLVLYENGGRDNGGGIDSRCGLQNLSVSSGAVLPRTLTNWTYHSENGDPTPDLSPDLDDSNWTTTNVTTRPTQVDPHQSAVFRCDFVLTPDDFKAGGRILSFGRISGEWRIFLNGRELTHQEPPKFDISPLLHPGANTLAVIVKAGTRSAGIGGGAELDPVEPPSASPLHWQISAQTVGSANKWQDPALDDSNWQTVNLPATPSPDSSANVPVNLTWYRLHFDLPAPNPRVWVPWKLHLEAAGNGFIYLNGHDLGRWWEIGPQKDFYLPECWLNFGPGATNEVTLCLRPTKGETAVQNASVSTYSDFAESR